MTLDYLAGLFERLGNAEAPGMPRTKAYEKAAAILRTLAEEEEPLRKVLRKLDKTGVHPPEEQAAAVLARILKACE